MNRNALRALITTAFSDFSVQNNNLNIFLNNLQQLNDYRFLQSNEDSHNIDSVLISFYDHLASNISKINLSHSLFVNIVLEFNWQFFCDHHSVLNSYCNFILHLISFYPDTLSRVFRRLVDWLNDKSFIFEQFEELNIKRDDSQDDSSNLDRIQHVNKVHEKVHFLIREIVSLFPLASQELFPALVEGFPFKKKEVCVFQSYMKNLLRISESFPVLGERIIILIIQKINEIDIEVTTHMQFRVNNPVFFDFIKTQLSLFDDEIARFITLYLLNDYSNSDETLSNKKFEEEEMIDKLDIVMLQLFEYFSMVRNHHKIIIDKIFISVLIAFDSEILPNNSQSNIQFALFFLMSFSREYVEKFLRLLLDRLVDDNQSIRVRQNSARFLASFLSHSNFVKKFAVEKVFDIFLGLACVIVDQYEPPRMISKRESEYDIYVLFYSICEALFEMFIHCYEDFFDSPESQRRIEQLKKIIHSKINPLQFCSQQHVAAFAIFAHAVKAIDCFPVLLCSYRFFRRDRSHRLVEATGISSIQQFERKRFFTSDRRGFFFERVVLRRCFDIFKEFYVSEEELSKKAQRWLHQINSEEDDASEEGEESEGMGIESEYDMLQA